MHLIQEFAKRPDLYDRNAPNYKDKAYHDELWAQLSHCLGYDVGIVKDRMIQIRNKYHLEKKRLDSIRADDPKCHAESKWPLYEQLAFLSDHIPVRRSFRKMRCKRKYSESEYVVKSEPESDVSDADRGGDYEYRPGRKEPPRTNGHSTHTKNYRNSSSYTPVARNTHNQTFPRLANRLPRHVYESQIPHPMYQRKDPSPVRSAPPGSDKFYAFGQFLTASLIELPEEEALVLIDQFTSDLVQVYLSKNNTTNETEKQIPDEDQEGHEHMANACNGHDDVIIAE